MKILMLLAAAIALGCGQDHDEFAILAPAAKVATDSFTVYAGPPDDEAGAERLRKGNQALRDKGVAVTVIAYPGNTDAAYAACGGVCRLPRWFGPGTDRPGQKKGVGLRWILNYVDSLPDPESEPEQEPAPAPAPANEPDEPETEVEVVEPVAESSPTGDSQQPPTGQSTTDTDPPTCATSTSHVCVEDNGKKLNVYLTNTEFTIFERGHWGIEWSGWLPAGVVFTVRANVENTNVVELDRDGGNLKATTEWFPQPGRTILKPPDAEGGRCTRPQGNVNCVRYSFTAHSKGVGTARIDNRLTWTGTLPAGWTVNGETVSPSDGIYIGTTTVHVLKGG